MPKVRWALSYRFCSKFLTLSSSEQNFENRLRFDKVIESLKVETFLRHSVYYFQLLQIWLSVCLHMHKYVLLLYSLQNVDNSCTPSLNFSILPCYYVCLNNVIVYLVGVILFTTRKLSFDLCHILRWRGHTNNIQRSSGWPMRKLPSDCCQAQ